MTSARWDDDEQLLADLADAVQPAPDVPEHLLRSAQAALTWRTIDEELALATLQFDSALHETVGVRGAGDEAVRTLAFTWDELSMEIEVGKDGVIGQLIPAIAAEVALATQQGDYAAATADEVGSFVLPRPAAGPVRLVCRHGESSLTTPWLVL